MVEIGIEILQHQLGEYLQRAHHGERIAITDPELIKSASSVPEPQTRAYQQLSATWATI
jgi:antitoxin (DNA-binding transcriptional repressor) of toxin-antitoxin stability system